MIASCRRAALLQNLCRLWTVLLMQAPRLWGPLLMEHLLRVMLSLLQRLGQLVRHWE